MAKYRGGIIGLGWTGMLYDLGARENDRYAPDGERLYEIDDADRPTPEMDVQRKFHYHNHAGMESLANTYAEALWDRPEIDLVAAAERSTERLDIFGQRYGVSALYTDAEEMLRKEKLDIVAIATNVKDRPNVTCLAAESGVKGISTQKPMAHTLEEADRMVKTCADLGVALNCGPAAGHPSFDKALELIAYGAIGDVVSIESVAPDSQRQHWALFVEGRPAWVTGTGDPPRRETGSEEFIGQGMMVADDGMVIHFRRGASWVKITGTKGEMDFPSNSPSGWRLRQETDTVAGRQWVEMPWPAPQSLVGHGQAYSIADIIDTLEGKRDEPKAAGHRVAMALEVEVALKLSSARGGERVELPLQDRSLGLHYDWYR